MLPCIKCAEVAYCSKECLDAHVEEHQASCDPVAFYATKDGKEIPLAEQEHEYMMAQRSAMECANCGKISEDKEALKRCAGCKGVSYCSKTCQKDHWHKHKTTCKPKIDAAVNDAKKKQRQKRKTRRESLRRSPSFSSVTISTQVPSLLVGNAEESQVYVANYIRPDGSSVSTKMDSTCVFELSSDADEMVVKIQGDDDGLIRRDTQLQFYNQDRSVSGWIYANANATSDAKQAYRTICETILEFGDPGRIGGRKGYFIAVVRRDMLMQVDCGDLVADNIEW